MKLAACIASIALALTSAPAAGQDEETAGSPEWFQELLTVSTLLDPPILEPDQVEPPQELPLYTSQRRRGLLQGASFLATGIEASAGALSLTELDLRATTGFPLPTPESPLLLSPLVGFDLVRDTTLDLPGTFFDVSLEARYLRPLNDRWTLDLAVTPGIYGNTETSESLLRIQGRAFGIYQWHPGAKLILGAVYLDRDDVAALPAAGLIWSPTDWLKLDILFPRPRIALRGYRDTGSAWWLYVGGEFGGGTWGMTRASGAGDAATLRDLRLLAGLERRSAWATLKLEGGYVFGREVTYASGLGDADLDDAALIRAVVAY